MTCGGDIIRRPTPPTLLMMSCLVGWTTRRREEYIWRACSEGPDQRLGTMGLFMHPSIQALCLVLCITSRAQGITDPSHFYPYGLEDGDEELPTSDDGGSGTIPLPIQFVLFGTCMNALWVSLNGGCQLLCHNRQSNKL